MGNVLVHHQNIARIELYFLIPDNVGDATSEHYHHLQIIVPVEWEIGVARMRPYRDITHVAHKLIRAYNEVMRGTVKRFIYRVACEDPPLLIADRGNFFYKARFYLPSLLSLLLF
jgi:hypothetical protein